MTKTELDRMFTNNVSRKWSPVKTEECPVKDTINGGWFESDEQLRARLKGG